MVYSISSKHKRIVMINKNIKIDYMWIQMKLANPVRAIFVNELLE